MSSRQQKGHAALVYVSPSNDELTKICTVGLSLFHALVGLYNTLIVHLDISQNMKDPFAKQWDDLRQWWHSVGCTHTHTHTLTAMMKKKMKQQHKQHSANGHSTHCLKRLQTISWTVFHGDVTHRNEVEGRLHSGVNMERMTHHHHSCVHHCSPEVIDVYSFH